MFNPNYRYIHLAKLFQVVNGPLPGMQAIRRIDQNFGTTYFNDLFHRRQWPLYVQWFGLEDQLTDMAIDYAAELYDSKRFDLWLANQKTIKSGTSFIFTPTLDLDLRTILSLNELENNWLFVINRTNLRRELSKNGFPFEPSYLRFGYTTQMHITYALFARRTDNSKLYAYCLAQAILEELHLKLFDLPRQGNFQPLPTFGAREICGFTDDLIKSLEPSIIWSFDSEGPTWFSSAAMNTLGTLCGFAHQVIEQNWPDESALEKMLILTISPRSSHSLVSLCAPVFSDINDARIL